MTLPKIQTLQKLAMAYEKRLAKLKPQLLEINRIVDDYYRDTSATDYDTAQEWQREQMYLRYQVDALENIIGDILEIVKAVESMSTTMDRISRLQDRIKKSKKEANDVLPTKLKIK